MKTSSRRGRRESHTIWGTFNILSPFRFELVPDIITWQPPTVVVDGGEVTPRSQFQSGSVHSIRHTIDVFYTWWEVGM